MAASLVQKVEDFGGFSIPLGYLIQLSNSNAALMPYAFQARSMRAFHYAHCDPSNFLLSLVHATRFPLAFFFGVSAMVRSNRR
jgi:hypothetical protein